MVICDEPGDLLGRPYAERQQIVVADDEAVVAERAAQAEAAQSGISVEFGRAARAGLFGAVGTITAEVIAAAATARSEGLEVLTVSRTEARFSHYHRVTLVIG